MKATKPTDPLSLRMLVSVIGLSLLLLPLTAQPAGATQPSHARAHAASAPNPGQAQSQQLGQPTTPLEKVVNRDGTLNLNTGFRGSLDPSGWEMATGPDDKPRFVRAESGNKQTKLEAKSSSARMPLVSGDENWDDRFYSPGVDSYVEAIAISGTDVYVGGEFTTVGRVIVNHIARWDGSRWYALGSGVGGTGYPYVRAIAISGSDVYVGGVFTTAGGLNANNIARWDGSQWYPLGSGVMGDNGNSYYVGVKAIAIGGTNLYVGGYFTTAGGVSANYIARWDGSQWYPLGTGVGGDYPSVYTIAISGSNVFVGGDFWGAGGINANNVARWDGTQWHPLGSGASGSVNAIAIYGTNVYLGGEFGTAGGVNANRVARWDGSQWYPLGTGVSGTDSPYVYTIAISGSDVYVGGQFTTAGGVNVSRIARWDGSQWYPLDSGVSGGVYGNSSILAIAISGSDVYAGGAFTTASGVSANDLARWDGSQWYSLGSGTRSGNGASSYVHAITIDGNDVYVGGWFTTVSGIPVNYVARWDGSQWYPLGSGTSNSLNGPVKAIAVSGGNVYAGGSFAGPDGKGANAYIARWDGSQWYPLGSGLSNGLRDSYVEAIAISGSNVYVGGQFSLAGGVSANNIARWDGSQWYPLGNGVDGSVKMIAISGSYVYVGGGFVTVGGVIVNHIARWDGSQWYPLGSGVSGGVDGGVIAIAINGNDVYVGGGFATAGGISANNIARWDGSQWYPLGSGVSGTDYPGVYAIAISGSNLYMGGYFTTAGGVSANNIARWDGSQWYPLGSGTNNFIWTVEIDGLNVYAGGGFTVAGNKPSSRLGIWHDQWLASHMTWQGRPTQPDPRLQLPITLTLKSGITEVNYPSQSTSSSAYFTIGVGTLPAATYNWRAKNPKYLANSGTVALTGASITNLEMGPMRAGDANNDNLITALDFNILKPTYGLGIGDPGYDDRADFNGDQRVTIQDFNLLKVNFGQGGAPPIGPSAP